MLTVEDYCKIRIAHRDGMSIRQIARRFHHFRRKVRQVLEESEPRPYTLLAERLAPQLGPYKAVIEQILEEDRQAARLHEASRSPARRDEACRRLGDFVAIVMRGEIKMKTHGLGETNLWAVGIMVALLPFVAQAAPGQDLDTERWQLTVTPYGWLAGVEGNVKVRDTQVHVDVPFHDILDALDFTAMVHIEAQKGRWGLLSDVMYLAVSTDKDLNLVNAKLDLKQWIVEFGGFYRFLDRPGDQGLPMSVDVLLGGRYWNMDADLTVGPLGSNARAGWVDPFVGLRWIGKLTDWLTLQARGDVGGFGVYDDASRLTWGADGGAAFTLSKNVSLLAGYRALHIDRHQHSDLEASVTFAGPEVGLIVRF